MGDVTQQLLALNALVGLAFFEWSWYKFRRYRNPNAALDAIYPAYRRNDAKHWQKWKLYPGALTILIPRVLLIGVLFSICAACSAVLQIRW